MTLRQTFLVCILPDYVGFLTLGLGIGYLFSDMLSGTIVISAGAGVMFFFSIKYRKEWEILTEKLKEKIQDG